MNKHSVYPPGLACNFFVDMDESTGLAEITSDNYEVCSSPTLTTNLIGTTATVWIACNVMTTTVAYVGVCVSGASSVPSSDATAIKVLPTTDGIPVSVVGEIKFVDLKRGPNTFILQIKGNGKNTVKWLQRSIGILAS